MLAIATFLSCANTVATAEETDSQEIIDEVVVRAHPLSAEGLAQPLVVLESEEIRRRMAPSVGGIVADIPGVNSSSFGQAVGRPIIRGLGGPRVRVMEDRIDSLDVSVSSPDHAVTIEPLVAQSIEILKGPSTLLYGSGAIGGVVDVHTGRIPHEVPETFSGAVDIRSEYHNADTDSFAVRLDGGSGNFAFHFDGFYRDAGDYEIPGFAESLAQRAREEEEEDHHDDHEEEHDDHDEDHDDHDEDHDDHDGEHGHDDEEEAFGELPGSELRAEGGAFGLSYVGDRGFVGMSVSKYDARYGLPGHSHHHHGHEDEDHEDEEHGDEEHEDEEHEDEHGHEGHGEGEEAPPILDLEQTRIDLEAGLEAPMANITSINFRVGINDYEHTEFEEGAAGTTFKTESVETRIELVHEPLWGITGAAGIQISAREYSALGEEAFVQPVDTDSIGIFYVGQRNFGGLSVEGGLRFEDVEHDPTTARKQSFDIAAASVGFIYPLSDEWTLTGQFDHSDRAPIAEELYSNGPHLATQSFELGDESLDEEVATNISLGLSYQSETLDVSLSIYESQFDDFIYQSNTGLEEDELPLLQWTQSDATFDGFEIEADWLARSWTDGSLSLNAMYEMTNAELDRGVQRDLPRVPPERWRLRATLTHGDFTARLSYTDVDDQDDVAPNELETEGYEDLRLYLGYNIEYEGSQIEIFLTGRNLTDDEQRYHTSFIKDFAPEPGRTVEAGIRVQW